MRTGSGTTAKVVGGLVAVGVALLVLKWLAITAAILALPFGVWWLWDRSRAPVPAPGAVVPAPLAVATLAAPARPRAPRPEPVTTPVPVSAPVAGALLAADRKVTVTREEDHQPVLARHHRRGTVPTRRHAELRSSAVTRGTHRGAYAVEVRIDGVRVGELTAAMSERYRPLVHGAEARGRYARCEATVSHGERGFQVELRLPAMT